jgi:hypothetical protein
MEKRIDRRIKKKLVVSFGDEGFENIAITNNISDQGLCILSNIPLPEKQEIRLNLAIEDKIYEIKGQVIWTKYPFDKAEEKNMKGSGIKITQAPQGYFNYVDFFYWQNHFKDMP